MAVQALPMLARLQTAMPPASSGRVLKKFIGYDGIDGGWCRVVGTVSIDATPDVPVSRRVRLFDALTGRVIREVWSAADGTYSFNGIRAGTYFVIAHDHTLEYNAVIRDRIEAVPMVAA
jgi:hypothetical protein